MKNKTKFYISFILLGFLLFFLAFSYLSILILNQSQDITRFLYEIAKVEAIRIYEKLENASLENVEMQKLLDISIFEGEGYVHIMNQKGEILVKSSNKHSNSNINNIFELQYKNEEIEAKVKQDLQEEKSGTFSFSFYDSTIKKTATYMPIGKQNLFIMVVVTQDYLNSRFLQTIEITLLYLLLLILSLLLLVFYSNQIKEKNKKEIEKLKHIDSLLGKVERKSYIEIKGQIFSKEDWKKEILEGFKKDEFVLFLQPQIDTVTKKIVGAEALLRWNSSKFGFLYPDNFISFCEIEGLIDLLDFWVLEQICLLQREYPSIKFACNQSVITLYGENYISHFSAILKNTKVNPSNIEIELTESYFAEDKEKMIQLIRKFHQLGIQIAMDDFGTGYSSFHTLKILKLDVLKLDKQFIQDFSNSSKEKVILESIFIMAQKLGMKTVAEGVETKEQFQILSNLKCDVIQGYYFSKPISITDFKKYQENRFS